jgi:hypothetical protein
LLLFLFLDLFAQGLIYYDVPIEDEDTIRVTA